MKKWIQVFLALSMFSSFAFAGTEAQIQDALQMADRQVCAATADLKTQLNDNYTELGKVQMALDEAKNKRPYVEKLNQIRKATTVAAVASALVMAYTYRLGRLSEFKSGTAMVLNQYALAISLGAAKVTGTLALASQAGYLLTSQDIQKFQAQLDQLKASIAQLQQELQSCDQK
jgi:hypothetical protein